MNNTEHHETFIDLNNLCKYYGDLQVIHDVSFAIAKGEFMVFVGPSGSGKSTLLRMIAGLEDISSGELMIENQIVNDVPADARGLAMVFQSYALYPHMSVEENMGFALRMAGVGKAKRKERVYEVAKILQLEDFLKRKPANLSGGQRQRVAIGRAIVRNPRVFLFDEPLSNLDAALRVEMRKQLSQLHRRLSATMIYVTHDQVEAMTMADRIVVLKDGKIEQIGKPLELYNHPLNLFVAGFIGSPKMNFIDAKLSQDGQDNWLVDINGKTLPLTQLQNNALTEQSVTIGLRPDGFLMNDNGQFGGLVELVEKLGNETLIYLNEETLNISLTLTLSGQHNIDYGERIGFDFNMSKCHIFDHQGQRIELS